MKRMHDFKETKGYLWIVVVIVLLIGVFLIMDPFKRYEDRLNSEEAINILKNDQDYVYFYEQCSQNEQELYLYLYYTFYQFDEYVVLKSSDFKEVKDVFYKVMYDHPEFYYVNEQFEYQDLGNTIRFYPIYDYSKDEVKQMNQQIEKNTSELYKAVAEENDEVQKMKIIYDYLVNHVEYQENKKRIKI